MQNVSKFPFHFLKMFKILYMNNIIESSRSRLQLRTDLAREELANKTLHQVQLKRYGVVVQVHIGFGPGSVPGAGMQISGTCHRR